MKTPCVRIVLPVLAIAFATSARAQSAAQPPAELPKVVVSDTADEPYAPRDASTASKTDLDVLDVPQSIEVRDRQLLDDLGGPQSSYDVARTVAGAFNSENGQGDPGRNVPYFTFRGFTNNGAYLKDGHFINGWMSTTDMASVERVEFLKGPASFLYGGSIYTGDIGGVVNYVSKRPTATPLAAAELTLGSEGFARATLDLGGPLAAGGAARGRVNAAFERGGSFRDFATHGSRFIAPAASFQLSRDDTLVLLTEFARSHEVPARGLPLSPDALGIDPARNFIDPGFAYTTISAHNLAARYQHAFGGGWTLSLDLTQTGSHSDQYSNYLTYNPGDTSTLEGSHWKLYNEQRDGDLRLAGHWRTGAIDHDLLFGANVVRNRYHAWSETGWATASVPLAGGTLADLQLPPAGTVAALWATLPVDPGMFRWDNDARAFYVQDLVTLGRHAKLLVGARHDSFRNDTVFTGSFGASDDVTENSHVSPRIGVIWQPSGATSAYVVWAQAFSPNTGITLSGEAPPPELGELREAGVKWQPRAGLGVHAAAYALDRRHMAFADPADPNQVAILVAGETRSEGFELDVNGRPTQSLRVNVAASLMRGWIAVGEPGGSLPVGTEFAGVPRRTLNLWGVYSFGERQAWEAGGGFYWASAAWADAGNTFRLPAITQWDLLLSRKLGERLHLQLNARNLAERRNATTNGWGWISPGEPRSVYVTMRYSP